MHPASKISRIRLRIAGEWWAAKWWICECAGEIALCWAYWKKQRPCSKCGCCGGLMARGYAEACEGICWDCRQSCELYCPAHRGLQIDSDVGEDDGPF
jgi:hypothetical protein